MTFPNETLPKARKQKTTSLYDRFIENGAVMGDSFGLEHVLWFANNKKDVIGITGDGSFQTNIQELQTIVHYNLPIKLFIWK